MSRKRLLAAAAALYGASAAAAYIYSSAPRGGSSGADIADVDDDISAPSTTTFSALAPSYDGRIDLEETLMGLKLLRRLTLGRGGASGDVLEVCSGTGRNLHYYKRSGGVKSVTLAEPSMEMLGEARQKAISIAERGDLPGVNFVLAASESLVDKGEERKEEKGDETPAVVVFGPGDAVDLSTSTPSTPSAPPLPRAGRVPRASFDTVVDTFGLCSIDTEERAEEAVREMARACKPGGRMIMIEHGRCRPRPSPCCSPASSSSSLSPLWPFTEEWIDAKIDEGAREHRKKWGCWYNRDVEGIVRRALAAGSDDEDDAGRDVVADVESVRRWHFGTTVVIVARRRERGKTERRENRKKASLLRNA